MANSTPNRGANRRRSQRLRPRATVRLECRKGAYGLGKNLAKETLDISDCGARVVVLEELPANAEVELFIDSYGTKAIKRLATVRWQVKLDDGNYCIGVEFAKNIAYSDWQKLASPN